MCIISHLKRKYIRCTSQFMRTESFIRVEKIVIVSNNRLLLLYAACLSVEHCPDDGSILQCLTCDVRSDGVSDLSCVTRNLLLISLHRSFLFGYDSGVMTDGEYARCKQECLDVRIQLIWPSTLVIDSPNFQDFFNTDKTSPIIGAINSTFSGGAVFGSLMVWWGDSSWEATGLTSHL